jgi:small ligand-binding sensory domain FIST
MRAAAGIATGSDWQETLDGALAQIQGELRGAPVDLAMLFASPEYAPHYADLVAETKRRLGTGALIGCSGQGVIGGDREIETEPAISVLAFSLPGAQLNPVHVTQSDIGDGEALQGWCTNLSSIVHGTTGFIILADPFSLDSEALLRALSLAYPDAPLVGGLASGDMRRQGTHLFMDGVVLEEGAVVLPLGDPYAIKTVVAQGAEPIGEAWTITGATENVVETLGMRPAVEILMETLGALPPETQERARRNLLVGLAMNEYRDEFHRGDFLIRNVMGASQEEGWIAIGARPTLGQTLQFQIRDPQAADADLSAMLSQAKDELGLSTPVGALLCACNGRGVGLFGTPNHDAGMVSDLFGRLPLAGFFCNGEIGPVGGKPFLHGYTASLALIVHKTP